MALLFSTNRPEQLLNDFKKKIDQGHIQTWAYDDDGDFTHTPDQWRGKAWLRPSVDLNGLRFNIVCSRKYVTTWAIYGVYQGRFIESMVTHCHDLFSNGEATAKPTNMDSITTAVA